MRLALPVVAVALCALPAIPAEGHQLDLDEILVHALTPIDSVPTKEELTEILVTNPLEKLTTISLDGSVDFGVRLRAIRALPHFCTADCRDALVDVFGSLDPDDRSGKNLLLLRAAIEALGVAKTGNPNDVPLLVPYLDHPSRDIRAVTARAFRDMCNTQAIVPLRARYQNETIDQVRLAISAALRDLGQCGE